MKIILWLLASILSVILYRTGGMSKDDNARPEWIPKFMRRSWVRDWLIPFVSLGYLLTLWQPEYGIEWLFFLPCIVLTGLTLSTYWDWLFEYDNYWFSGFCVGLALSPLIFAGIHWYAILIRAVVLVLAWGVWCKIFGDDVIEEMGRGGFIIASLPLLII